MTDSRDLTKVAVAGQMSGHQRTGLGILGDKKQSGRRDSPIKKANFCVFRVLCVSACQHPAQNASTQKYGQPAPINICEGFRPIRSYWTEP